MTIARPVFGQPGAGAYERIRRSLRRHGAREIARLLLTRVLRRAYLREVHVWYAADLTAERPRRPLESVLELVRGGDEHLALLDDLSTVYPAVAEERLSEGNDWWLVLEDGLPVFSCWVFRRRVPMLAAVGGVLELPPGVAFLEDSITSPAARGRGVAPAGWSAVCDVLAREGQALLVTKVRAENEAVRRALSKVGFGEVGTVELECVLGRRRVRVEADGSSGGRLAATLEGKPAPAED